MKDEIISSASRSVQEQLIIQEEILEGKYGEPGAPFITTRALSESRQVSIVTAHNILNRLCASGYLELRGKKYYLSHEHLLEEYNSSTNIIGVTIPQFDNEFFSSLLDSLSESARKRGYTIIPISTSYTFIQDRKAIQLLQNLGVAGIISCSPTFAENEQLYRDSEIPFIFLGHSSEHLKRTSIQINSFPVSQKVVRHLLKEGYKKFVYIGTKNLPLEKDVRFTAFQMELKQNGYILKPENTLQILQDSKSDTNLIAQILEKQSEPVGVFCFHDLIAANVYQACESLGKKIPNDVGVVGFDDLSIASTLTPALTSIQYRIASMADIAVDFMISAIKSRNSSYDNYYIDPNLIVRDSSRLSNCKNEKR